MADYYDFRDADGNIFRADPRTILAQLGRWLEQRNGGVGRSSSLATSQASGSLITTLEVHHRSPDEEPETEREPLIIPAPDDALPTPPTDDGAAKT